MVYFAKYSFFGTKILLFFKTDNKNGKINYKSYFVNHFFRHFGFFHHLKRQVSWLH